MKRLFLLFALFLMTAGAVLAQTELTLTPVASPDGRIKVKFGLEKNPTAVRIRKLTVTRASTLKLTLAPGGGYAVSLMRK